MDIVNVQVREHGTVAKAIRSTTAGLTSGYQRTNTSTVSASAIATTGGYIIVELATLPWYSPFPSNEPHIELSEELIIPGKDELAEGYQAMAEQNSLMAEQFLPVALETLPDWRE